MSNTETSASKTELVYPDIRFAVISDPHFYAEELGKTGSAFENAGNPADTIFAESEGLLELAIDEILQQDVRFVLIPGDLTKDGEAASHEQLPKCLERLTANGVGVYVIPGNHDLNNPRSYRYEGDQQILTANLSSDEFVNLYKPFGYGQALLRHDGSLSYVAEPAEGLWLLAVDTTRSLYNQPGGEAIVGGRLTPSIRDWLRSVLIQAKYEQKAVVYMQHHGIAEHWRGQAKLHPDFLVEDFGAVGRILAAGGVRLAFTGHYHALDITRADFGDDGFLYDIETGSLAAPPFAVRICSIKNDKLELTSLRLAESYKAETDFASRAEAVIRESVRRHAIKTARRYKVSAKDAKYIADHIAAAFQAHYQGDEDPALKPTFEMKKLNLWGRFVYLTQRYIIDNLWVDLPPADDDVILQL